MLELFKKHISQKFPHVFTAKSLLAVSGGVDSMVLLHLYKELNVSFAVAHCNFSLRAKESDLDEELVRNYCHKNNIPFFSKKFDTLQFVDDRKVSIQIAARELRYRWFDDICKEFNYQYVATAHHLDDQVETFLINFTRGTGIDGLVGIPEVNGKIIRPLLIFSRKEIQEFALHNTIEWREDQSNATTKYLRNKMRHSVIPLLKEENSEFLHSFQNTIKNLKQVQALATDALSFFQHECVTVFKENTEIDLLRAVNFPNYSYYLIQYLKQFGFKSIDELLKLIVADSGKMLKNAHYEIVKDRDKLIVNTVRETVEKKFYIEYCNDYSHLPILFNITEIVNEQFNSNKNTIFVNSNLLRWPLVLRKKVAGDSFHPFGMKGMKKVSKFFKDEKLSKIQKDDCWILENGDGKIIWIVGLRADDRFKIINTNQKNYKITLNQ